MWDDLDMKDMLEVHRKGFEIDMDICDFVGLMSLFQVGRSKGLSTGLQDGRKGFRPAY